jgi:hypothetical protein
MDAGGSHWLCTNRGTVRLPDWAARAVAQLLDLLNWFLGGRIPHSTWVRYRLELEEARRPTAAEGVELTPLTSKVLLGITAPRPNHPQLLTAARLWQHELRNASVWLDDGEPICIQWLFTSEDNAALSGLTDWAGMYPPLPAQVGQMENLLVLGKGWRRPGGAATPFTYAMYELAYAQGLRRLVTHILQSNTAARRWADRTGWKPCGTIRRYHLNMPLLRGRFIYVHSSLPAAARLNAPAWSPPQADRAPARGQLFLRRR